MGGCFGFAADDKHDEVVRVAGASSHWIVVADYIAKVACFEEAVGPHCQWLGFGKD